MDPQMPLTKKERRKLKQQESLAAKEAVAHRQLFKKIAWWGLGGGLTAALIGGLAWYTRTRPPIPESSIISRGGFHWHSELAVYVKGVKQEIPPNLGIGTVHQPIHTHEDNREGIIHMEFQGLVREQDLTLGRFFKIWNKDIRSLGTNIAMVVNREANTEYENYVMRDRDKIELSYE